MSLRELFHLISGASLKFMACTAHCLRIYLQEIVRHICGVCCWLPENVSESADIPDMVILSMKGRGKDSVMFLIWRSWTSSEVCHWGRRQNWVERGWEGGSYAFCQSVPLPLSSTVSQCLWKPPLRVHSALWMFRDKWWEQRWCGQQNSR